MREHDTTGEKVISNDQVSADQVNQPRLEEGDADRLDILTEAGSEAWPPLVIAKGEGPYTIIDGRHRLEAVKRLAIDIRTEEPR